MFVDGGLGVGDAEELADGRGDVGCVGALDGEVGGADEEVIVGCCD